jgi:hypothetical protein
MPVQATAGGLTTRATALSRQAHGALRACLKRALKNWSSEDATGVAVTFAADISKNPAASRSTTSRSDRRTPEANQVPS